MKQWIFCQFLNVILPAHTENPPIENFLATVVLGTDQELPLKWP